MKTATKGNFPLNTVPILILKVLSSRSVQKQYISKNQLSKFHLNLIILFLLLLYIYLPSKRVCNKIKINFKLGLGLFAKQQFALFLFSLLPYSFLTLQVRLWSNGCESTKAYTLVQRACLFSLICFLYRTNIFAPLINL